MSDLQKKPMSRSEIVSKINSLTNINQNVIKDVIAAYEKVLLVDLVTNNETRIGVIGKIKIKQSKSRIGINPANGEKIVIPAKIAPKFSFSKGLKEYIAKEVKLI